MVDDKLMCNFKVLKPLSEIENSTNSGNPDGKIGQKNENNH